MTLYRSRESELQTLHAAILAEKNKLFEEMKFSDEQQESYSRLSEAAHSRNQALLRSEYWESVEQELPKWEQFLLGKSQLPFGMTQTQQRPRHSQTMQTPKRKTLPPSGCSPNTFPR
ncbi:centrosomal protein 15 isoform X3 [Phyllobates terribilis]|uniref:centrosomal protein 15 isoform X3 n=1 Tax=Phyllobates terribilis TaxID=111132 RepID=UPI003CCB4526